MLPKQKLLFNLFGIILFFLVVGVLVVFDKPIRRIVNIPRQMVAGARDVKLQELNKETFQQEITADSKEVVGEVSNTLMHTTISDVLSMKDKTGKIIDDMKLAKDGMIKMVKDKIPRSLPLNP